MKRKICFLVLILMLVFSLNACNSAKKVEYEEGGDSPTNEQEEFISEHIEEEEIYFEETEDATLYEDEYLYDDMEKLEEDEILP